MVPLLLTSYPLHTTTGANKQQTPLTRPLLIPGSSVRMPPSLSIISQVVGCWFVIVVFRGMVLPPGLPHLLLVITANFFRLIVIGHATKVSLSGTVC